MSQRTSDSSDVDLVDDATVTNVARAALFAALTGAFAYVSFPFPLSPAPVTLQVLGVFLAGILLGPVWGGAAMVLYLAAGAMGAPVFAGGAAGFGVLVSESAGYLWSYPIAAAVVGLIAHGGREVRPPERIATTRMVAGMIVGTVIIYALGVLGLILVLGLSFESAVIAGALVFLPAEAVKMAAAIGVVRSERLTATPT